MRSILEANGIIGSNLSASFVVEPNTAGSVFLAENAENCWDNHLLRNSISID